ncbi:hypothetical protein GCM10011608_59080 [Micromonospora sonchi]|uniref:Aminotransferase class V domain-containing protein n=1 Tax=Micromonospora sonchi TaxID=1763543 RepID=A0A917U8I4_9ACTN|nr:hypothetical protein [Micromonospora sonchi]GGM65984.1 hypothetical protein GCM10011608_59080 [Micromonospora sonchi]
MSTERYTAIGVRPLVNGVGPATRLGGLPLHPQVLAGMTEATAHSVRMDRLQAAAGRRLAELLGVPAAYVTTGAAGGLALATAVAMAGDDPRLIDRLPDPSGMRHAACGMRSWWRWHTSIRTTTR